MTTNAILVLPPFVFLKAAFSEPAAQATAWLPVFTLLLCKHFSYEVKESDAAEKCPRWSSLAEGATRRSWPPEQFDPFL